MQTLVEGPDGRQYLPLLSSFNSSFLVFFCPKGEQERQYLRFLQFLLVPSTSTQMGKEAPHLRHVIIPVWRNKSIKLHAGESPMEVNVFRKDDAAGSIPVTGSD